MTVLASRFDHAVLGPERTDDEVRTDAARAAAHGIRGICVFPRSLAAVRAATGGTSTVPIAVVNFPAGASTTPRAFEEAARAVEDGAEEIDVVVPSGWLRAGELARALDYLARIGSGAPVPMKAIVEAASFDDDALARIALEVVVPSGAAWFKTGTGVYGGALEPERIRALRRVLPEGVGLKVSGGIRDVRAAAAALESGADLLGTSRTFAILALE